MGHSDVLQWQYIYTVQLFFAHLWSSPCLSAAPQVALSTLSCPRSSAASVPCRLAGSRPQRTLSTSAAASTARGRCSPDAMPCWERTRYSRFAGCVQSPPQPPGFYTHSQGAYQRIEQLMALPRRREADHGKGGACGPGA